MMDERYDITVRDRIKTKLKMALAPVAIEVSDESAKHANHAPALARPGIAKRASGTHFRVKVVSNAFKGKSRIERHRAIIHILRAEFAAGVHSLAIEAKEPGE